MEDKRFDQLARALGGLGDRRGALKALVGGTLAGALGLFGLGEAEGKKKGKGDRKKRDRENGKAKKGREQAGKNRSGSRGRTQGKVKKGIDRGRPGENGNERIAAANKCTSEGNPCPGDGNKDCCAGLVCGDTGQGPVKCCVPGSKCSRTCSKESDCGIASTCRSFSCTSVGGTKKCQAINENSTVTCTTETGAQGKCDGSGNCEPQCSGGKQPCGEYCYDPSKDCCIDDKTVGKKCGSGGNTGCYNPDTQCCANKTVGTKCGSHCITDANKCCLDGSTVGSTCGSGQNATCYNPATQCCNNSSGAVGPKCGGSNGTCCTGNKTCSNDKCCPTGQTNCGGACTNLDNDKNNCGSCNDSCPNDLICSGGHCGCTGGLTVCGKDDQRTCVNTTNDKNNCGGCGISCGTGQSCENSTCTCPDEEQFCDGKCLPKSTFCGDGCTICDPNTQHCSNGICCAKGFVNCGNSCVDLDTDNANCGKCGNPCGNKESCINGTCTPDCTATCDNFECGSNCSGACGPDNGKCPNGLTCSDTSGGDCQCGKDQTICGEGNQRTCKNLQTDPQNCGGCGKACSAGESCIEGTCTPPTCDPTCDPQGKNPDCCGITCTNLDSDPTNCGTCGNSCGQGKTCVAGSCTGGYCPPEQKPCDGRCIPNHKCCTNGKEGCLPGKYCVHGYCKPHGGGGGGGGGNYCDARYCLAVTPSTGICTYTCGVGQACAVGATPGSRGTCVGGACTSDNCPASQCLECANDDTLCRFTCTGTETCSGGSCVSFPAAPGCRSGESNLKCCRQAVRKGCRKGGGHQGGHGQGGPACKRKGFKRCKKNFG